MTFRRSGFQGRPQRSSRIKDWGLGPQTIADGFTGSGTNLWTTGTVPGQNLTVIRTRGWIAYYLTVASAGLDGFRGASGICMVNEDAFNTGAGAVPDPLLDANSDLWLWHSFFDVRAITATIADGANAVGVVVRQEIDSKAMRKGFDPEMAMIGVTEVVETGTATLTVFADTRQLFLS